MERDLSSVRVPPRNLESGPDALGFQSHVDKSGAILPVVSTNSGPDAMEHWPPDVRLAHIIWRQTQRCGGEYLQRLAAHETSLETLPPR